MSAFKPHPVLDKPFLATDVGGTHARMAIVSADADGRIEILDQHKYMNADFPGMAQIIAEFLSTRDPVDDAAIGCAGMRRGDTIISLNLPWPVPLPEIEALGIRHVAAVNDFVAVAHAEQCLGDEQGVALTEEVGEPEPGPVLIVGPGTGFGAAYRVQTGRGWKVMPSEAGQMSLAPGTVRELRILEHMLQDGAYVSAEQAVTGPGLLRLYKTLCALDGHVPLWSTPAEVATAAVGDDAQAHEAVMIFCAQFGSVLADAVMTVGATRVYVAGGIVTKIHDLLSKSTFNERFLNKGVMRQVLERVPVRLIDNPHKGVIGAASWYVQQVGDRAR